MRFYCQIQTPLGRLLLIQEKDALVGAGWNRETPEAIRQRTPLLEQACRQLEEYFSGKRRTFAVTLRFEGTPFQQQVWTQLLQIPYGETRTYGELAHRLGKPDAARAVGAACGKNPLLIFLPCHRVVGTGGRLTGFAAGLEKKAWLLALERRQLESLPQERETESRQPSP